MMNNQTMLEEVNTPKHYRSHESGIEAIDVTKYMEFDLGNCWKYCMRYQDKGTPAKDILKAVWYIKDFTSTFIDYKNDCVFIHKMPEEVISKMCKIEESEPNPIIKKMFSLMIMLTTLNSVINRKEFDEAIFELEAFGNSMVGGAVC